MDLRARERQVASAAVQVVVIGLLYAALSLVPPRGGIPEGALCLAGACAMILGLGVRRRAAWCLHAAVLVFTLSAIGLLHLTVTEFASRHAARLAAALWAQFVLFRAITSVQVFRSRPPPSGKRIS